MADPGAWAPAEGERRALAEAGLAVWSGRLILDAQPPVDDPTLAEVAGRCNGSLPEPLVSLWRASFGGRLDYDLEGVSFTELFHPGSDDYDDLWGWIDHERGLIDGRKLDHLPFGGFEYLDRLYVQTRAGEGHGAVVVWQQGLPPGWELTDGDRAGAFADDLPALFGRLALESDPWVDDDGDSGADMRDAVDELAGAEPELAARLRSMVRAAVLDWRGALADGSVAGRERLRRLAFDRASAAGDVEVLGRLVALGCDPAEQVRNGLTPIDLALVNGRLPAVEWLLARDVPVTSTLRAGAHAVDAGLASRLIDRGAVVTADAFGRAVDNEDTEVLRLLAGKLTAGEETRVYVSRLRMLAAQARHAGDADRAAVLGEVADRLDPG